MRTRKGLAKKRASPRERLSRALRRQWLTGALLQRKLWTVAQLADVLGVSKATCQRDLDLLAELFVVRTVKDPRHRQRSCYRMDVAFKPTIGAFKPLFKLRRAKKERDAQGGAAKKRSRRIRRSGGSWVVYKEPLS